MIVGGYELHLYCDHGNKLMQIEGRCHYFADFAGVNQTDCMKQARQRGWKFNFKEGWSNCPLHRKASKKPPE